MEDATQALLANVELESDVHKQVALLAEATLKGEEPVAKPSAQDCLGKVVASKSPAIPLTLSSVLEKAGIPEFHAKSDSEAACVRRVQKLYGPMQTFVRAIREEEGFASKSALDMEGEEPPMQGHNVLQKRLAAARQEFELSSARRSRMQLWTTLAERCVKASQSESQDTPITRVPQSFRPSCTLADGADASRRDYQVLCARTSEDDKLRLVVVQFVFRGAVCKSGTRAQRATKPHFGVLPATMCSKLQACVLTPGAEYGSFYCNNTSLLLTYVVASNQILFELAPQHYTAEEDSLQLWLHFKPEASRVLNFTPFACVMHPVAFSGFLRS